MNKNTTLNYHVWYFFLKDSHKKRFDETVNKYCIASKEDIFSQEGTFKSFILSLLSYCIRSQSDPQYQTDIEFWNSLIDYDFNLSNVIMNKFNKINKLNIHLAEENAALTKQLVAKSQPLPKRITKLYRLKR